MSDQKFKRRVYLNMMSLERARQTFIDAFKDTVCLAEEMVPVEQAGGRVTARPIWAERSSPADHLAAMDGLAVRAESTFRARADRPVELAKGTDFAPVNTGHLLPQWADAVIMIEQVIGTADDDQVTIEQPVFPWQNVRKLGEDLVATELILPAGWPIGPAELGALVAGGVYQVPVKARPRVAVIPTGSEVVSLDRAREKGLQPGQLAEFNSLVLAGLIERSGGVAVRLEPVADDLDSIRAALDNAVDGDYDLVIINAGSSSGTADYTVTAVGDLGRVLVHGVTMMPGKPTVLGEVRGKPVMGNPGYPVSAVIAYEQLAEPLLAALLGRPARQPDQMEVWPVSPLPSKAGQEEFVRVKLGRVGQNVVAVPLHRGAGSITSLTKADGVIRIPADREGVEADRPVAAELIRPPQQIDGTIVAIGSHDLTLDLLADLLRRHDSRFWLSSGHVGSLGGLTALVKNQAHLAGSHLLDTETGEYNIAYLKRLLPDRPVKLVRLVQRDQGFIVPAGNPKGIKGLADLARDGVSFVNRQAGAGTRVLLDHHLTQAGISRADITGYENEEYTHMAVAAAVLSGRADVGLGVLAAARALKLDFISLASEQYELVIPAEYFDTPPLQALLEVIRGDEFRRMVLDMGGYGLEQSGQVIWES